MKRAAFIDHSFKINSKSSFFFVDILKKDYSVDIYWDYSWNNGPRADLKKIADQKYDLVVFFQMLNFSRAELKKHSINNVVFVPMYDSAHIIDDVIWEMYTPYKFISFCHKLHRRLLALGLNSMYVQYYSPPVENLKISDFNTLNGFFWQRYDLINWNHISSLIKHSQFDKIHIHKAIDPPGYEFYPPTTEEIDRYQITISDWFKDRNEYMKAVEDYNVFFAPRKYEGIGMSFLEAMALGKCVVAPNLPTMNEYIQDGYNGVLYDLERLKPLNFDNVAEISRNAVLSIENGYQQWEKSKIEILKFCAFEKEPLAIVDSQSVLEKSTKEVKEERPGIKMRIHNAFTKARFRLNTRHPRLARFLFNLRKKLGLEF